MNESRETIMTLLEHDLVFFRKFEIGVEHCLRHYGGV